jgi:hypothetical protein
VPSGEEGEGQEGHPVAAYIFFHVFFPYRYFLQLRVLEGVFYVICHQTNYFTFLCSEKGLTMTS